MRTSVPAVRHLRRPTPRIREALKTNPYTPLQLRRAQNAGRNSHWTGMGEAWTYLSLIISGVIVWGGVGFALDAWLETKPVLTIVGSLAGHFLGIYAGYVRAFRPDAATKPQTDGVTQDAA